MKVIKKAYSGLIKTAAIAIAVPGFAITKTVKAITYGLTENETARGLADIYEAGGEILMAGALSIEN